MAIKRYWRLICANTSGGTTLELSECRLYEGGVIADAGATLTCTIAPATGALSDLRDGVATAVVSWPVASYSAPGWSLIWDFGVGGGVDAPKLRLGSGTTQANWLLDATLQYCTDGVSWVTYIAGIAGISYPGASALTPVPDASAPDIYAASNSLLLLGNGTNGSTSIVDSSVTNPKTVTAVGNVQISTAQSKFGGSSIYFDGTSGVLDISNNNIILNYFDFCVDMWIRFDSVTGFRRILSSSNGAIATGTFIFMLLNGSSTLHARCGGSGIFGVTVISINRWYHVRVNRRAMTLRLYLNGILEGSEYSSNPTTESLKYIGGYYYPLNGEYYYGYIDDIRLSIDESRGIDNFTPPTDLSQIPPIIPSTYTARATRLAPVPERLLPAVELPNTTASTHAREYTHCDIYYGGDGSITGTVKEKHSPANTPLFRRVLLIDERSQQVVRETWSDAITGNFAFNGVKIGPAYSTLSFDHLHNYRAVVADNLSA